MDNVFTDNVFTDNVFTDLEYLSNPAIYEKYKIKKKIENDEGFKKEKKFYKKRIIQLTKNLYNDNIQEYNVPLIEIKNLFNKYVHESVELLKLIDNNDCLQEEYIDLSYNDINKTIDTSFNVVNNDILLFNKPVTNKIEDCFPIIKKRSENKSNIKIPIQKKLNLKDLKFKTKGVKKKE